MEHERNDASEKCKTYLGSLCTHAVALSKASGTSLRVFSSEFLSFSSSFHLFLSKFFNFSSSLHLFLVKFSGFFVSIPSLRQGMFDRALRGPDLSAKISIGTKPEGSCVPLAKPGFEKIRTVLSLSSPS